LSQKSQKLQKRGFSLSRPKWPRQRILENRPFSRFILFLSFRPGARRKCISKILSGPYSIADSISHQCAVVGPSSVAICSTSIDSRFPLPSHRSLARVHGHASSIFVDLSTQ
jgi:hypothetical protein